MKNLLVFISAVLLSVSMVAQKGVGPKPSPAAKVEQVVGLTDVSVTYSRPGVKEREIFGNLVSYGKVWRTGANNNTVITFGDDVKIGGTTLSKGSYGLYTIPNKTSWEVIFYKYTDNWGVPKNWDAAKIVAKTTVVPQKLNRKVETLTIGFGNVSLDTANLVISWENTLVEVKINVPTKEKTLANIAKLDDSSSARDFFEAGVFYKDIEDYKNGKVYIDKAIAKKTPAPFWMLRQQSLIYSGLGEKKKAIEILKESLESAKKANNTHYQKLNTDTLKEWGVL